MLGLSIYMNQVKDSPTLTENTISIILQPYIYTIIYFAPSPRNPRVNLRTMKNKPNPNLLPFKPHQGNRIL